MRLLQRTTDGRIIEALCPTMLVSVMIDSELLLIPKRYKEITQGVHLFIDVLGRDDDAMQIIRAAVKYSSDIEMPLRFEDIRFLRFGLTGMEKGRECREAVRAMAEAMECERKITEGRGVVCLGDLMIALGDSAVLRLGDVGCPVIAVDAASPDFHSQQFFSQCAYYVIRTLDRRLS